MAFTTPNNVSPIEVGARTSREGEIPSLSSRPSQEELQHSFERLSLSRGATNSPSSAAAVMAPPNSPSRLSFSGSSDCTPEMENLRLSTNKNNAKHRFRPYYVPSTPSSSASRSSFEEYQTKRHCPDSVAALEGDVEELRFTLVDQCSTTDTTDRAQVANQQMNNSCSVEAMRHDTSEPIFSEVDLLAEYLNHFVYVRLKLSPQVESMYT
uniref:Oxidative stress-responsive serine-rich protein 1 n=1 Tax=Steinernema glaseri TaxID=37863 RepID=A0A1I8AHK3_9BILA